MFFKHLHRLQKIPRRIIWNDIYILQFVTIIFLGLVYFLSRSGVVDLEQWLLSSIFAGVFFLVLRFIFQEVKLVWVILGCTLIVFTLDILWPLAENNFIEYDIFSFFESIPTIAGLSWMEILLEEGVEEIEDDLKGED